MRSIVTVLLAGTVLTSPAWATINPAQYGLSESSDNTAALQRAFDAARRTGEDVVIPNGRYAYSNQLRIDGIKVRGSGNTVLAPSNPENQRLFVTGNSPSVSSLEIDYKPIIRNGAEHGRNGIWVEKASNFTVSGVTFDGQAYGTPTQGGGGNLFIYRSTGGTIRDNTVKYAQADSIHITGGSKDIDVTGNRIVGSNDDGIAVVNYGDGAGNVRIDGNTVTGNRWGRNITAVGASDVKITNNFIDGNAADGAGVYVASEPAYNTAAPRNVLIEGNTIQDTGGPGKGHGQIMLRSGKGPVSGVTIKDNDVRDSKRDDLAVVLSGSMSNVTLEGNNIDGEISRRNGGGYAGGGNTTNDSDMASAAPVPAGTPAPSGSVGRTEESPLSRNFDSVADNINNTDDQFWQAVEQGEAEAMRRLNDLVSGGILIRQGNRIINRATGQVTSTVGRTLGDAVDAVIAPVEETVGNLGDAIICGIGGGWAAVLVKINICASKQLKVQGRILDYERRNNAAGTASNAAGLDGMMARTLPNLGRGGFLSHEPGIVRAQEQAYPDLFQPMPGQDLIGIDGTLRQHERDAHLQSFALENRAVQEQAGSLSRARDYAAAGRAGEGIRAELQAANAIQGEQIAAINSLTAATVGSNRAAAEVHLRHEAMKKAANATAEEFMSNLATCGNCNISRPFLGN